MNSFDKFIQEQEVQRQIETKNLLDKINYRQDLINEKDKIIKNLNYEKELITDDIVSIVKSFTSSELTLIWGVSNAYYDDTWRYFHYKDEIKDEDKKKKMKNTYDLVLMQIKSKILLENKDFKLQNIYFYGYDKTHYSFVYKYKKHVFELKMPMFDTANKETYITMMSGYQVLIQIGKYSWSTIICDLSPDVVANKLKEYIEKLEVEDD